MLVHIQDLVIRIGVFIIKVNKKTKVKNQKISCEYDTFRDFTSLPTGKLEYKLTNDYMFRAVMQSNTTALKGLLYALLRLPEGSIENVEIMNPIELGESIDVKTCILDLKIMLNDNRIINIEMQLSNLGDWKERSLIYLSRTFDNVSRGDRYISVIPCVQIGILDYSLDGIEPKLYSEYKMMDTVTHDIE